jgi:2-polyprenyl-3-methyl-5-hydroxy-6-metoxy-1,4-benzoquinol methylase
METVEINRQAYNTIAKDWMKDHQSDDWWVEGTDAFLKFLPVGGHVLDVGCAGGWKSRYMVDRGFQVLGIDFSEKFIELARAAVPEATFQVLDLNDVDMLTGLFDGVFVQAVLLHVPKVEIAGVLKKFVARLQPGGFLYVAVKEQRPSQPAEEVMTEDDYGYAYTRFFSYYTPGEMIKLFVKAGLRVVYQTVMTNGQTKWINIIGRKGGGRG